MAALDPPLATPKRYFPNSPRIKGAQNSKHEKRRGELSRECSGKGTSTSIRTSTIKRNCRWPGKAKTKTRKFADTCRASAQQITCQVDDAVDQRVHQGKAERMLLARLIVRLGGGPSRQVRYTSPNSVDGSFKAAVSVQDA